MAETESIEVWEKMNVCDVRLCQMVKMACFDLHKIVLLYIRLRFEHTMQTICAARKTDTSTQLYICILRAHNVVYDFIIIPTVCMQYYTDN